ncbi:hypothetical protein FDK12_08065 [Arthrobacter sp. NamB2]|uniref:hypothetical protein n=1 Tax=Arthrobacter sp. NamB2 TaxID=2576035 RepID=UPI0010C936F2|nr:hypothetical protein [Arthrobacter sp. NamB2]TKV28602.1 hypothetical protein FDK12_08065 [Arthrobacter sp. NamB2]
MMKSADPFGVARRSRQDEPWVAAEKAERLREELTRARCELELHRRHGAPAVPPADAAAAHRSTGRGPLRRKERGVGVAVWFVTFYLLLAILASPGQDAAGYSVHQPAVVGEASTSYSSGG